MAYLFYEKTTPTLILNTTSGDGGLKLNKLLLVLALVLIILAGITWLIPT